MGLPLLWALGLHALLVLSGAWSSRTEMTEAEPPPPVEALEVEVVSEPPLPGEEPGGGSMEAGQAEFAGGLADEPEPAVGQEPGPEVTEPAARSEAVVAIPDAEDVDVDAYAVDTPETLVTRLRPNLRVAPSWPATRFWRQRLERGS